jgi:sulfate transport system substrate-binding protein
MGGSALTRRQFLGYVGIGLAITLALGACGQQGEQKPAAATGGKPAQVELTLVSYAVTAAAYEKIIPLFAAEWKAKHQQDVVINASYGGSGSQSRAVIDGLEADVVALALEPDIAKIEEAGLIQPGWQKDAPHGAIVTRSVAALITRPGNPKGVKGWADLAKPGLQVITANPKTSGGARWNFLGLWSSVNQTGGSPEKALDFTAQVLRNVPVLPKDAREATDAFFKQKQGDVLINYENEVKLAEQKGQTLAAVIPPVNISIDAPVAVVDANVDKHGTRAVAEAFVQFLFTPAPQREFAQVGFRPVLPELEKEFVAKYPPVKQMVTVEQLGGWPKVQKAFFAEGGYFDQALRKAGK